MLAYFFIHLIKPHENKIISIQIHSPYISYQKCSIILQEVQFIFIISRQHQKLNIINLQKNYSKAYNTIPKQVQTIMSDSQFQDLTASYLPNPKLVKQIQSLSLQIKKIKQQKDQLKQTVNQMRRRIQDSDKQLIAKDNVLKAMTLDNIKLVKKMIQCDEEIGEIKEELLDTENQYKECLESHVQEKSSLIQLNQRLNERVDQLQLQKRETEKQIDRMKQELQQQLECYQNFMKSQQTSQALQAEWQRIKCENSQFKLRAQMSQNQINQLRQKLSDTIQQLQKVKKQKQAIQQANQTRLRSFERQTCDLRQQYQITVEQLNIIRQHNKVTLNESRIHNTTLHNSLQEKQNQINALKLTAEKLSSDMKTIRQQNCEQNDLINNLRSQNLNLKKQLTDMSCSQETLNQILREQNSRVQQLEKISYSLQQQMKQLQNEIQDRNEKIAQYEEVFSQLRQQSKQHNANAKKEMISSGMQTYQMHIAPKCQSAKPSQIFQPSQPSSSAISSSQHFQKRCIRLQKQLKQLQQCLQIIQKDLQHQKGQNKSLQLHLQTTQTTILTLQQRLSQTQADSAVLQKQYDQQINRLQQTITRLKNDKQAQYKIQNPIDIIKSSLLSFVYELQKNMKACKLDQKTNEKILDRQKKDLLQMIYKIVYSDRKVNEKRDSKQMKQQKFEK